MNSQIGAGARIRIGDAAAPMNTANGGAASDADLDDVTEYLANFNISTPMGTVDITKLNADQDAFFRRHIAGLRNASATSNYGDDNAGTFERRIDGIQAGTAHVKGRGKVDVKVRPAGDGSGKIQYTFTAIPTDLGHTTEVEAELGGSLSWVIDGQITKSVQ